MRSAISDAMISLLEAYGATLTTGLRVNSLDELDTPDIMMLDVAPRGGRADRRRVDAAPRVARAHPIPARARTFKVEFAVEGGVPWTHEQSRLAGTVHVGGS